MQLTKWAVCLAWIKCLQKKGSPIDTLQRRGIREVIVYGVADLGEAFVAEATNRGYTIKAITDAKVKKGNYKYKDIPIITGDDLCLPEYRENYVVITAIDSFDEIRAQLEESHITNILSLYDLME